MTNHEEHQFDNSTEQQAREELIASMTNQPDEKPATPQPYELADTLAAELVNATVHDDHGIFMGPSVGEWDRWFTLARDYQQLRTPVEEYRYAVKPDHKGWNA